MAGDVDGIHLSQRHLQARRSHSEGRATATVIAAYSYKRINSWRTLLACGVMLIRPIGLKSSNRHPRYDDLS